MAHTREELVQRADELSANLDRPGAGRSIDRALKTCKPFDLVVASRELIELREGVAFNRGMDHGTQGKAMAELGDMVDDLANLASTTCDCHSRDKCENCGGEHLATAEECKKGICY